MTEEAASVSRPPGLWRSLLLRRVPFVLGWRNITIIGTVLGLLSVAITLLLEPFGTADYRSSWRTLKLSGNALGTVVPFLVMHALDRAVYRWQGGRWWLANELVTRTVLFVFICTANWLYNIRVINDIRPSFAYWADFMVNFALPPLPIFLPTALLLAYFLATRYPEPPPPLRDRVRLQGQGKEETLTFDLQQFLYAEAQQNYVAIHLERSDGTEQIELLRLTLADLQRQFPDTVRIHRSYVVHPARVLGVRGTAKKRQVLLEGIERPLPASQKLDSTVFGTSGEGKL